ncbi:MAG TPA: nucleotide pyrophosphohydrolase [Gemmatimonadales bacterium]|nr:nucleotide pyrophosphohydrolase [Gemmatimonadales bacterium]
MSFRDAQDTVDRWIGQFEEGYFPPLANVARLAEEVGEVAREVNHRFGPKVKKADEPPADLGRELADVLFVVICLANSQQIDLDRSFDAMMGEITARDASRWTRKAR